MLSPFRGRRGFYDPVSEMNRMFDDMLGGMMRRPGGQQQRAEMTEWAPAIDVVAKDGDLVLRAELPGIKQEDVDITLHENVLTVSGERKAEQEEERSGYYVRERRYGSFSRSLTLYRRHRRFKDILQGGRYVAERRMCDVCGVRPAVTTMKRIAPGEPPRTEYLCEVHAAQARGGRTPFEGRSSFGGGGSLFDDFFNRFFDEGSRRIPIDGGGASPRRQAEQVDITQFFSDSTGELLQRAAQQAAEWGSLDLNTEHLLWAALGDEVARRVLAEVDADPDALKAQIEEGG